MRELELAGHELELAGHDGGGGQVGDGGRDCGRFAMRFGLKLKLFADG